MSAEKEVLLMSAARLVALGEELKTAREVLRMLVEVGVPIRSPEVKAAYREFRELEARWKKQEELHLRLRDSMPEVRTALPKRTIMREAPEEW